MINDARCLAGIIRRLSFNHGVGNVPVRACMYLPSVFVELAPVFSLSIISRKGISGRTI